MKINLENSQLKVEINLSRGARIETIYDQSTEKNWMWHPRNSTAEDESTLPLGSSYDDNWTGGWDDIFPNDEACSFNGRTLVDHGEIWGRHWDLIDKSCEHLSARIICSTVPMMITKNIKISENKISLHYLIENLSNMAVNYLFKLHPALAIEPNDVLLFPQSKVEPVDLDFSTYIGTLEKTNFPNSRGKDGGIIDISKIPPEEAFSKEFMYISELSEGYCGLQNPRTRSQFILRFNSLDFPFAWVFQSFNGWRNHYVTVLEPCTNKPKDLNVALKNKNCAILEASSKKEFIVTVAIEKY